MPETPEGNPASPAETLQRETEQSPRQTQIGTFESIGEGAETEAADDIILDLGEASQPPEADGKLRDAPAGTQQAELEGQHQSTPVAETPHRGQKASPVKTRASTQKATSVVPKARISIPPGSSIAERR